ncbi:MAG: hypothetical protein J2P31_08970 [Blastocatellia bacterium]|nr:hypothetical protein [Blastocatellia bacterium]
MRRFERESALFFDQPSARMFFWPVEMMLRFHANMANTLQATTVAWAHRRQEAADDAIKTIDRFVRSRDIEEAVTAQREWLEGSIRRLDQDFHAIASQTTHFSRTAASTAREAVAQSSDVVRNETSQAEQIVKGNGHDSEQSNDESSHETPRGRKHSKSRKHHKRAS